MGQVGPWLARGDLGVQPHRVGWDVGARVWLGWLVQLSVTWGLRIGFGLG